MYTLYWSEGTASFGPQALLEEAQLDYRIIEIDISAGKNHHADYLAINPYGKVPVLKLSNAQILCESAAIMLYLADRHQLTDMAPPVDHPLRGLLYQSLFYLSNTIQDGYKLFYYPERFSTHLSDSHRIKTRAVDNLLASWQPVNDQLMNNGPYHLV